MDYQKLFNYMSKEHGVTLLEQDMQEIVNIVTESDIDSGFICVKKLDESDIIEAGWKPNDLQSSEYLADYILNDYTIDIFDYGIRINKRHDTIFKGKIKNYNELLNVMKMLNINPILE